LKDPFINRDGLIEEIYELAATYRNKKIIPSIEIKTNYLGMELLFGIFIEDPKKSKELAAIQKRILLLEERAKEFKYTFKGRTLEIGSISFNDLREKIIVNGNENTKKIVTTYHEEEMYQSYLNNKRSEALFHAQSVLSYLCEKASWENINNLGYIYFSLTKYRLARNYFKKAAEDIYPDNALTLFNLGIVEIKYNRYSIAKKYLEKALNKVELIEKKDRNVTCLYIPKIKNSKISFEEESNPDLLENIKKAIKMTEAIISI
jgi:tetratricopeptide (TPR) repeat protein